MISYIQVKPIFNVLHKKFLTKQKAFIYHPRNHCWRGRSTKRNNLSTASHNPEPLRNVRSVKYNAVHFNINWAELVKLILFLNEFMKLGYRFTISSPKGQCDYEMWNHSTISRAWFTSKNQKMRYRNEPLADRRAEKNKGYNLDNESCDLQYSEYPSSLQLMGTRVNNQPQTNFPDSRLIFCYLPS